MCFFWGGDFLGYFIIIIIVWLPSLPLPHALLYPFLQLSLKPVGFKIHRQNNLFVTAQKWFCDSKCLARCLFKVPTTLCTPVLHKLYITVVTTPLSRVRNFSGQPLLHDVFEKLPQWFFDESFLIYPTKSTCVETEPPSHVPPTHTTTRNQ